MFEGEIVRLTGVGRRLSIVLVLAVLCGVIGGSSASAKAPSGDFAIFGQCPRFTAGVSLCFYSQVTGGTITLGKQTVPIDADGQHAIVLQGGVEQQEVPFTETFVGALNGETISKTPQSVSGGLAGAVNCNEIPGNGILKVLGRTICQELLRGKLTSLSATTELAGPASSILINRRNLVVEEGTALSVPVKVHLENPLLGRECYIGSDQAPIVLNFTTGTTSPAKPNEPIKGHIGEIKAKDEFNFVEVPDTVLVENEFSAPQATGCGGILSFLIDPLIDQKIGLPSPDGNNTAIQDINLYEATSQAVTASEQ